MTNKVTTQTLLRHYLDTLHSYDTHNGKEADGHVSINKDIFRGSYHMADRYKATQAFDTADFTHTTNTTNIKCLLSFFDTLDGSTDGDIDLKLAENELKESPSYLKAALLESIMSYLGGDVKNDRQARSVTHLYLTLGALDE